MALRANGSPHPPSLFTDLLLQLLAYAPALVANVPSLFASAVA